MRQFAVLAIAVFTLSGCLSLNDTALQAKLKSFGIDSLVTERGVVVQLSEVFFEFDKSDLTEEARSSLIPVAELLTERSTSDRSVNIEGHTDNIGSEEYNINLSRERAASVQDLFVTTGVQQERVSATGLGAADPIADNATREGRSQNRRVEIVLSRN